MRNPYLFWLILFTTLCSSTTAQNFQQYFDGADTMYNSNGWDRSLFVEIAATPENRWQIGRPQKTVFSSAATDPNAIVTDTIGFYPTNNLSSFQFTLHSDDLDFYGILALQWMQKLDMTYSEDYAVVEYSFDGGEHWDSPFDNPNVYNFYGYDPENIDTLPSGEVVFTGTDSTWKDIWLCFDLSFLQTKSDSIIFRYLFQSDNNPENKEGWMIDNLNGHITIQHTITEEETDRYMSFTPNPVIDRIYIDTKKQEGFHIIEYMELLTNDGKVLKSWKNIPTRFFVDMTAHPNGTYILRVKTNIKTEAYKFLLDR